MKFERDSYHSIRSVEPIATTEEEYDEDDDDTIISQNNNNNNLYHEQQQQRNNTMDGYSKACGLLFVLLLCCEMIANRGVRGTLIDYTSIPKTAENISTSPILFRIGILADTMSCFSHAAIAVLLGVLFWDPTPVLSVASSVFRLLHAVLVATQMMWMILVLLLLDSSSYNTRGPVSSSVWLSSSLDDAYHNNTPTDENHSHHESLSQDLAYLSLLVHKYGSSIAYCFLGISTFLLGEIILVRKRQGDFPHCLGICFCLGGLGFIVNSCLFLMSPNYGGEWTNVLLLPSWVAECVLIGWLLCHDPSSTPSRRRPRRPTKQIQVR